MPTNNLRRIFLDTNVLVYDVDASEPVKKLQTSQLLHLLFASTRPVISTQIVSEYVNVTSQRLKPALTIITIHAALLRLSVACEVVPVTLGIIQDALRMLSLKRVSWWDALVHATAVSAGITDVLSEDLVHLGVTDNITYHDPYVASFDIRTLLTP